MKNVSPADLCKDDPWLAEQLAREKAPANRLAVPEKLARPSLILKPVITAINSKRRQAVAREAAHCIQGLPLQSSIDFDGLIFKRLPLTFRVTIGTADRALLLVDTLLKACKKRGLDIFVEKDGLHIGYSDFSTRVRISERVEKKNRSLNGVPMKYEWMYRPFSYTPTGELTIYVDGLGSERKVSDKPNAQLESQLIAVIALICRSIAELRVWSVRRAIEDRERVESGALAEAKRMADATALAEIEAKRLAKLQVEKNLIAEATAWQHANLIRKYSDHLNAACVPSQALTAWISWARKTADEIDPTTMRVNAELLQS